MAVCGLRTVLLIVCIIQLIVTVERQVFDFLGYMWLSIIANFVNILLIIFGSFGAVQYITKYLIAYAVWSLLWLSWNTFLICYYLNLGNLNRESGLLSLGTGSVSWWESNGWGCQPMWGSTQNDAESEDHGHDIWRPTQVEGCLFQWDHVELGQSVVAALLTLIAMPLAIVLAYRSLHKQETTSAAGTLPRRPVYTVELNTAETNMNENTLKPMTPRRVKRRSGSRGNGSSVRRSRRSYRNAGYLASTSSLPRDNGGPRPTSAHSSYSNFHGARPTSSHIPDREVARSQDAYDPPPPCESITISTRQDTYGRGVTSPGYDVVGPYNDASRYEPVRKYDNDVRTYDKMSRDYDALLDMVSAGEGGAGFGWEAPPPPAPPFGAPGPPAYHPDRDHYANTLPHA